MPRARKIAIGSTTVSKQSIPTVAPDITKMLAVYIARDGMPKDPGFASMCKPDYFPVKKQYIVKKLVNSMKLIKVRVPLHIGNVSQTLEFMMNPGITRDETHIMLSRFDCFNGVDFQTAVIPYTVIQPCDEYSRDVSILGRRVRVTNTWKHASEWFVQNDSRSYAVDLEAHTETHVINCVSCTSVDTGNTLVYYGCSMHRYMPHIYSFFARGQKVAFVFGTSMEYSFPNSVDIQAWVSNSNGHCNDRLISLQNAAVLAKSELRK